jgi:hypothetical protein
VPNKHFLGRFRLNKPHSKGKVALTFNQALHHEDVFGCRYSSTHAGKWKDLQILPLPSIATSALKMETVCLSETLACTDEFTRRQNPKEHHHPHGREKLKSHIDFLSVNAQQLSHEVASSRSFVSSSHNLFFPTSGRR